MEFMNSQKDNRMIVNTKETTIELAQVVLNPEPDTVETKAPVCQPGDKECVARWVQAFSDCE